MNFSQDGTLLIKDSKTFNDITELDKEIFIVQKSLFDLRLKKSQNQTIKTHLIGQFKRQIARLKIRKYLLLKTKTN